jgi:protein phosphatase 2C family protein 2/3
LVDEENNIYCANAGDSRSVLSNNGTAVPLSFDHKPVNQEEYNRICNAGGFVEFGRVNGMLLFNVSFKECI